jgi:hypothetical protein
MRPKMLPFTRDQFIAVFATYNAAIWPAQVLAYIAGAVALVALFRPSPTSDRLIASVLAAMWIWTGATYHLLFFTEINRAALGFGIVFIVQGALFAYLGLARGRLSFRFQAGVAGWVGLGFVAYASILYPLIGIATGHTYPELPMFGVTPCPVTIFTLGMLLLATRLPFWLLIVPTLWSLIGGSAAILLDVPQDWLLLVSGVVTIALRLQRSRTVTA